MRFFADQLCFLQILDGSLNRAAGYRQIRCHPVDPRPCFSFPILSVKQIEIDELCPMGKLAVFIQLMEIRHTHLLLILSAKAWRVLTALSPDSFPAPIPLGRPASQPLEGTLPFSAHIGRGWRRRVLQEKRNLPVLRLDPLPRKLSEK